MDTTPSPRRFIRPTDGRVLGGVGAGLGRYFGVDPLIPRIVFVVMTFVGFIGPIAYVGLLLAPAEGKEQATFGRRAAVVAGVVALGITAIVGGTAMIAGAVWATAAGGGWVVAAIVLALGALGAVAAVRGHRLKWVAPLALVLALPAGVTAAADLSVEGGVGERSYRPLKVADIPEEYRLGMGELVIDLRDLRWPAAGLVEIETSQGIGETVVLVPEDVCVEADADLGVGAWDILGDDSGGVDLDGRSGSASERDRKRLRLDADIGIGHLRVDTERSRGWDGNGGPFGHRDDEDVNRNPCGKIDLP